MTAYKATHSEILVKFFAKSLIELRVGGCANDCLYGQKSENKRHRLSIRPHTLKSERPYWNPPLYDLNPEIENFNPDRNLIYRPKIENNIKGLRGIV